MAAHRIDEMNTPPVPGRVYLVPTVRYIVNGCESDWPIIGPKHEDKAIIGFSYPHYHIDGRFLTKRQSQRLSEPHNLVKAVSAYPLCRLRNDIYDNIETHPPIEYRQIKCRFGRWPHAFEEQPNIGSWRLKLEAAYADAALVPGPHGAVCPHKGAHLGCIAPNEHGEIVCPLHGLRWNAETGRLSTRKLPA